MKKLLILTVALALFAAKTTKAQFIDVPPGVSPGTGSFCNIVNNNFAFEFTRTSTGFTGQTWFFGTTWPYDVSVSINLYDHNGNLVYSDGNTSTTPNISAQINIPGFDWNDYGQVEIEWSSSGGDDVSYEYFL